MLKNLLFKINAAPYSRLHVKNCHYLALKLAMSTILHSLSMCPLFCTRYQCVPCFALRLINCSYFALKLALSPILLLTSICSLFCFRC